MIARFLARHFRSPRQALATDHPPHIPVAECLHALESRYMFDAAGVATGAEAAVDAVAQGQAEQAVDNHLNDSGAADAGQASDASSPADNADTNDQLLEALATHQPPAGRREVVFVDTSVEDYRTLIAGIDPSAEVVLLDTTRDGVEQIAEVLAGRSGIDAIHIVSHGSQAELELGTARLTLDSMNGEYADELAAIGQALTREADILVYGCNFGEGGQGQEAAATLAATTGADVAASDDLTGSAALGGDWDLEFRVGSVETTAVLSFEAQANFMGLLATWDVHDDFNPPAYDGNDGSANWNGNWQEVNDDNNSATGLVYAFGGVLNREIPILGDPARGVWRGADLSQALNATLSFDHKATVAAVAANTTVDVQVSDDGGMNWTTVLSTTTGTLVLSDTSWVTSSVDISGYATANTQIRLLASSAGVVLAGSVQFDNVEISYTVNDAPVIISNGGGATASVSVSENTTAVTTVAATDANVPPQSLTYSLIGGADQGLFSINPSTGALSFNTAPNFEAPADTGANNVYDVTVQVSDGNGGTDTQAIAVTVTDANDAPVITSSGGGATASVSITENTTAVTTVAATDVDVPAQTLTYSLIGGADQTLFSINSSTGALTFNAAPDFEAPADFNADNVYEVTVEASDGSLTDTQALSVTVIPVNDAPSGTDNTVTTNEDTTYSFATVDFGFIDVDAGDALSAVRIDTPPAAGSLTLSGVAVSAGQVVSVADLTAGNLLFTPAANANGSPYASFSFAVRDTGGPAFDPTPNTMTVNVRAVNDAPVNTVPGPQTVAEDTALALSGVSVNDAEGNLSTVALSVANGILTVTLQGGTTISAGANGSAALTLLGTQADLTATLASLVYQGSLNYTGPDMLTVTSTDTNSASDTDTIAITVIAAAPAAPAPPGTGGGIPEGSPSAPGSGPSSDDSVALGSEVDDGSSSKTSPVRKTTASDDSPVTVAQPVAVSRVDFRSEQDFSNDTSQNLGSKQPVAKQTNAVAASAADVQNANDPYSTLKANRFLEELNRLRDNMNHELSLKTLALSIGLSVGYAIWLVRGGVLLSSLLSSLPAWRWLDPLPVLAHLRDPRDDEEGNEDSLQAVLKNAEARDQSKPIPDVEVVPPAQPAATGAALSQPDAAASLQEKADVSV